MEVSGALVLTGNRSTWQRSTLTSDYTLFADDAAGICPFLEKAKRFCQHVTDWVTVNKLSVGIAKCGLMEFLPNDSATVPLVPGQVVVEGLPLPIVDKYMYLGILMTPPGLTIESMVNHRGHQGQATVVATVIPYLQCPVLPMSMRLVTVAVVVGHRLLFGAELYCSYQLKPLTRCRGS